MKRPSSILAVIDLSGAGRVALEHALALGARFDAGVDVLHDGPGRPLSCTLPGRPFVTDASRADEALGLAQLLAVVRAAVSDPSRLPRPMTVEVGSGGALTRRILAGEYDLVVLGRPERRVGLAGAT